MTANQTNYIYYDTAGVIQVNTTGFPASTEILPIGIVVAGASTITSYTDARRTYRYSNANLSVSFLSLSGGTVTGLLVLQGTGSASGLQMVATAAPGSPADGQVWYDSTAKVVEGSIAGVTTRFPSVMYLATASSTVANTTTETTIVGSGVGTVTLAANQLTVGKSVRVRGNGYLSTTGSPTLTINVKLGSLVLTTGAVSPGTGVTNVGFYFDVTLTCRTTGAGGGVIGQGFIIINGTTFHLVQTVVSVVDTTGTLAVAATAIWSAASASNTITATNFKIDVA